MKIGRRSFLSLMALQYLALKDQAQAAQGPDISSYDDHPLAIQQGFTDGHSSEFSIVCPVQSGFRYTVIEGGTGNSVTPTSLETVSREFSAVGVDKVYFSGLQGSGSHRLRVTGYNDRVIDEREFSTLDLNAKQVKFAICSCMNDHLHRRSIWESLQDKRPDLVFFIGDSVYADQLSLFDSRPADRKQLWERYVATRERLAIYHQKRLVPILATWDDHDFGDNNADRDFPYAQEAKDVFETFFAQRNLSNSLNFERGPGVSSFLSAFGQNFFLLDGRSFRSPLGAPDSTHFGVEQEQWLFEKLQNSHQPNWLFTGNQWFGGYREKESYECDQPETFARFMSQLAQIPAPVVFGSGDVHYSEVMEIESDVLGYPTVEVTSSSVHSLTAPGWHLIKKNPRRLMASSRHQFTLVQSRALDAGVLQAEATSVRSGGRHVYSHRFEVGVPALV